MNTGWTSADRIHCGKGEAAADLCSLETFGGCNQNRQKCLRTCQFVQNVVNGVTCCVVMMTRYLIYSMWILDYEVKGKQILTSSLSVWRIVENLSSCYIYHSSLEKSYTYIIFQMYISLYEYAQQDNTIICVQMNQPEFVVRIFQKRKLLNRVSHLDYQFIRVDSEANPSACNFQHVMNRSVHLSSHSNHTILYRRIFLMTMFISL